MELNSILMLTFTWLSFISLLLFLEIEDLKKIFTNRKQIFASGHSAFSLMISFEYFNSFKIKLNNNDYTFVKYLFLIIILLNLSVSTP